MPERDPDPDRRRSRPDPPAQSGREPRRTGAGGDGSDGWMEFAIDVGTSITAVLLVGLFLTVVSGVGPPLVAVQSESMQPNMHEGDLVFVMSEERFAGAGAVADTGVVTAERGAETGYSKFGGAGDVIVFAPDGNERGVPIIHRAMFWVEAGENWVERANSTYLSRSECETDDDPATDTGVPNCPAPHAGFITKGDYNSGYDQVKGISTVVKPSWVVGSAETRLPGLGWLRLTVQW